MSLDVPDPLALAGMSNGIRASIAGFYRDAAAWYRDLDDHDTADRLETRASALLYGGSGAPYAALLAEAEAPR